MPSAQKDTICYLKGIFRTTHSSVCTAVSLTCLQPNSFKELRIVRALSSLFLSILCKHVLIRLLHTNYDIIVLENVHSISSTLLNPAQYMVLYLLSSLGFHIVLSSFSFYFTSLYFSVYCVFPDDLILNYFGGSSLVFSFLYTLTPLIILSPEFEHQLYMDSKFKYVSQISPEVHSHCLVAHSIFQPRLQTKSLNKTIPYFLFLALRLIPFSVSSLSILYFQMLRSKHCTQSWLPLLTHMPKLMCHILFVLSSKYGLNPARRCIYSWV